MSEREARVYQRFILMLLIAVFAVGFVIYLFASNAIVLHNLDQQKEEITQKIENEKIRSNQLDVQVKQMGSKHYVEYFARKYLGLYYPDEIIVIVEREENASESGGQTVEK